MPYECTFVAQSLAPDHTGANTIAGTNALHADCPPVYELTLWPYQSLPRIGFVWFIGLTAAFLALPLVAVLGSPVLWGLMPFLLISLAAVWWALRRSQTDNHITENLSIWHDHIVLVRNGPRGARAEWAANPYWVKTTLHAAGGPVPNYLTLRGGDREVELGAFLSEPERITLQREVDAALHSLRGTGQTYFQPASPVSDTPSLIQPA